MILAVGTLASKDLTSYACGTRNQVVHTEGVAEELGDDIGSFLLCLRAAKRAKEATGAQLSGPMKFAPRVTM